MRGGLARALGEALQSRQSDDSELDTHQVLLRILNQQFTEPLRQRGERMPNAGVLLLTKEQGEDGSSAEVMVRIHHRKHGRCVRKHYQTLTQGNRKASGLQK